MITEIREYEIIAMIRFSGNLKKMIKTETSYFEAILLKTNVSHMCVRVCVLPFEVFLFLEFQISDCHTLLHTRITCVDFKTSTPGPLPD